MIHWKSEKEFSTGGIDFTIDFSSSDQRQKSTNKHFVIIKNKKRIENYLSIARENKQVGNLLELGFSQGGSLVFFDKIFEPAKIIAIDMSNTIINPLEDYSLDNGSKIKTFYGVTQTDSKALDKIIQSECNNKLDLIIDDASHWYKPSKQSFIHLFPKLQAGGKYIIETWNWSFKANQQKENHSWFKKHSLANLLFELIEDIAINHTIEKIEVLQEMAIIHKSKNTDGSRVFSKKARRGREMDLL